MPVPPQIVGRPQSPHSSTVPQPSPAMPHLAPRLLQVSASQGALPQRLGPSPPQNGSPEGQLPQLSVPPQPSGTVPHSASSSSQVAAVQVHSTASQLKFTGQPP